ncbi:MAG: ABC transporter ATP-binding protein [Deltaproteobacteria bacterium]|nr:ABC transporter ATP-binding protein [Deltaproteobacteria bacterium]
MLDATAGDDLRVVLEVEGVTLSFGGVNALLNVSLQVENGSIYSIIGPNGAGKSSLFNVISGLYRPQRGSVLFKGQDLTLLPAHKIAPLGLARSFQQVELFKGMTVIENLLLGRHIHMRAGLFSGGLFWGKAREEELRHRQVVEKIIDFLEIEHIREKTVATLPYGLRKRLELGRALALEPELLLLDEPMAGLNQEETEDMARFILDINQERRTTLLLIEHDMGVVMDISDRVAVLNFGELLAAGTPHAIQEHPAVIEAYLGAEDSVFPEGRSGSRNIL